jgi:RimJ/RimL family protein N-acetyltransferase
LSILCFLAKLIVCLAIKTFGGKVMSYIEEKFKNPHMIDLPWPIETDRLILRPALPGDGAQVHEALEETWKELQNWMIFAQKKMSVEEVEANIRECFGKFLKREDMRIHGYEKTKDGLCGEFVLSSGIHRFDWHVRRFEIGYWVRKSAMGKGYATECAAALAQYAFDVMGARNVSIEHADGNEGSRRVIEKLGFEKEGVLKGKLVDHRNGDVLDSHVYSMSNADHLRVKYKAKWGHLRQGVPRC